MDSRRIIFQLMAVVLVVLGIFKAILSFYLSSAYEKVAWITAIIVMVSAPFLLICFHTFISTCPRILVKYFTKGFGNKDDGKLFFKEHVSNMMVFPSDLDLYFHMNNARYQTQIDVARANFYLDCGLSNMFTTGSQLHKVPYLIVAATSSRYRKSLQLFQRYRIITRVLYWDHNSVYIEHKFVSRFRNINDFVYYVCVFQMRVVNSTPVDFFREYLNIDDITTPKLPEEVGCFIKFNEFSSANLKKHL